MTNRTETAAQLDYKYVWHPFTPMLLWEREGAPVIERGEGCHVWDLDGNELAKVITPEKNVRGCCLSAIRR